MVPTDLPQQSTDYNHPESQIRPKPTNSALSFGTTHTFAVRAIDQFGRPDPTPASHAWTIEATYASSNRRMSTRDCSRGFGTDESRGATGIQLQGIVQSNWLVGCVSVFKRWIKHEGKQILLGGFGGTCTRDDVRGRGIGSRVC